MKQTATVLKFKGERLKTPKDVQAVELAVLEDLRSGALTAREARQIHIQIAAMLKQFADEVIKAKGKPTLKTPLIVRGIRLELPCVRGG
jgi:hypothetical protein